MMEELDCMAVPNANNASTDERDSSNSKTFNTQLLFSMNPTDRERFFKKKYIFNFYF